MDGKGTRLRFLVIGLVALGLATLACEASALMGTAGGGTLTVTILSPAAGSSVPVGEVVTVQAEASDPNGPGVIRIDLQVDEATVDTFEAGAPQPSLTAELTFTPTEVKAVTVAAVAFREDGTASDPATISLSVEEAGGEPPGGGETGDGGEGEPPEEEPPAGDGGTSDIRVEARANLDVNIREAPGPGCPIIGVWPKDQTGFFLEVTDSPMEYWYQTDFLGETQLGWVYHDPFTLLEDDSILPRVRELGCLFCGDGVLSPELGEACDGGEWGACGAGCEPDCTCTPYCGDGAVNQSWEECDGGGCGDGYSCTECICVRDPYCGDGEVNQSWEECDGGGCGTGFECIDCVCVVQEYCGDGIVQSHLGEGCDPPNPGFGCTADCQLEGPY